MEDVKEQLIYGLPDSRIYRIASKITVISDNGTETVIKEKHHASNGEIILDRRVLPDDLTDMMDDIMAKEVIIKSDFYRLSPIKNLLTKI